MLGFLANTAHHHEVSIRIVIGCGEGWCLGIWPRLNTSMMRMRPLQQGHGVPTSSSAAAVLTASVEPFGVWIPSSLRAAAMHPAFAEPANSP
jgi:hypothetical protein